MGIRRYRETLAADPAALAAHEEAVARLVAEHARASDEEQRAITERSRERIRELWSSRGKAEARPRVPRLTVGKVRAWVEAQAADAAELLIEAARGDPELRERLKAKVL